MSNFDKNAETKFDILKGGLVAMYSTHYINQNVKSEDGQDDQDQDCVGTFSRLLSSSAEKEGYNLDDGQGAMKQIMDIKNNHYGLYLLMKTIGETCSVFKSTEEDWVMPGLSNSLEDKLIQDLNIAIFCLEFQARSDVPFMTNIAKLRLEDTMALIGTDDKGEYSQPKFDEFMSSFSKKFPWWGAIFYKLASIFAGKESLEENIEHFEYWWEGHPASSVFEVN